MLTRPDNTVSSIARLLGVSRATICKYVPEVTTGRVPAALIVAAGTESLNVTGTITGAVTSPGCGRPRHRRVPQARAGTMAAGGGRNAGKGQDPMTDQQNTPLHGFAA